MPDLTPVYGLHMPNDADPLRDAVKTIPRQLALDVESIIAGVLGVPAPDAWHLVGTAGKPAYQNAWATWAAAPTEGVRYRKDSANNLHIQGAVQGGTSGTAIFTLPVGYRPSRNVRAAAVASTGVQQVRVATDGQVLADAAVGGGGYLLLNVVAFLA